MKGGAGLDDRQLREWLQRERRQRAEAYKTDQE